MPISGELYNQAVYIQANLIPKLRTVGDNTLTSIDDKNVPNEIEREYFTVLGEEPNQALNDVKLLDPIYWYDWGNLNVDGRWIMYYIESKFGEPYTSDYDWLPLKTLLAVPSIPLTGDYGTSSYWNLIFNFLERLTSLILRYSFISKFIWYQNKIAYTGNPPTQLNEVAAIDDVTDLKYADRKHNSCWLTLDLYWFVYCDPAEGNLRVKTSSDLVNWSSPTTIDTGVSKFCTSWLVGDNTLYVLEIKGGTVYLYKLTLSAGGSISTQFMLSFGALASITRATFGIRGTEMWFFYTDYEALLYRVYRRKSDYPFTSVGASTLLDSSSNPFDHFDEINDGTYLHSLHHLGWIGGVWLRFAYYDGISWTSFALDSVNYQFYPFIYNAQRCAIFAMEDTDFHLWDGTNYYDYDTTPYYSSHPVAWVDGTDIKGVVLQQDPDTFKYRIQYFTIKSDYSVEWNEATDWIDDAIYPYTTIDRKNGFS